MPPHTPLVLSRFVDRNLLLPGPAAISCCFDDYQILFFKDFSVEIAIFYTYTLNIWMGILVYHSLGFIFICLRGSRTW